MTTKEKVFQHLKKNIDKEFVSGQEIANECGISRQAVWKAIRALRKEGVTIDAATKTGYKLHLDAGAETVSLSERAIVSFLPVDLDCRICCFDEVDSTNRVAKKMCENASTANEVDGTVVVADSQTNGRGRLGRSFFSPKGSGIYMSLIYAPHHFISPSVITSSVAVAVCRAIQKVYGVADDDVKIKWVNDVFLRGKKVCGILTEGITNFETGTIEYAIIGIGINVLPSDFSPEISNVATSIFSKEDVEKFLTCDNESDNASDNDAANVSGNESEKISGKSSTNNPIKQTKQNDKITQKKIIAQKAKRNALVANIISEIFSILKKENGVAVAMKEYQKKSFLVGKKIKVFPVAMQNDERTSYLAKVLGVTEDAKLVVQKIGCDDEKDAGSVVELDSGEITLHE